MESTTTIKKLRTPRTKKVIDEVKISVEPLVNKFILNPEFEYTSTDKEEIDTNYNKILNKIKNKNMEKFDLTRQNSKPLRKLSAYNTFVKEEFKSNDYSGLSSKERMKRIAEKWNQQKEQ